MTARTAAFLVLVASAAWSQNAAISWKSDLEFLAKEFPGRDPILEAIRKLVSK